MLYGLVMMGKQQGRAEQGRLDCRLDLGVRCCMVWL